MGEVTDYQKALIQTAIAGGPLGDEALAEFLWMTNDSGDGAWTWTQEHQSVKNRYLSLATAALDVMGEAYQRLFEANQSQVMGWLGRLEAQVMICNPHSKSAGSGPQWRLSIPGHSRAVSMHESLVTAATLLKGRIAELDLWLILDTKTSGLVSGVFARQEAYDRIASAHRRDPEGSCSRYVLYSADSWIPPYPTPLPQVASEGRQEGGA